MLQAYRGYFSEEVKFCADDGEVMIPTNKRVMIRILEDGSKHIPLKERLKDFRGEYEFEEWDTGADVGIEVIE